MLLNGCSAAASGSVSPDDHAGARQATEYLLAQGHRDIAMVADLGIERPHYSLYERRAGFEAAMQAAGRRVPQDISLISFNDVFPAGELKPSISVVSVPSEAIGTLGAEMLLRQIREGRPDTPETLVLDETLIPRQSSAAAPVSNPTPRHASRPACSCWRCRPAPPPSLAPPPAAPRSSTPAR